MIVRKYNRRNRSLTRNCSDEYDAVSDEYDTVLSQENSQDVFGVPFSSQGSSSRWSFESDLFGSNCSQDSGQLGIRTRGEIGVSGIEGGDLGGSRVLKKPRNEFDFEAYGLDFSQESQELAILPPKIGGDLEIGGGVFGKSKKVGNGGELGIDGGVFGKSKKVGKKGGKVKEKREVYMPVVEQTKTLMETQEFGEMMEHEDEVYFALDGLRKGQQARIRRASLLSLLAISKTAQQRRHLRTNGTAKTILDAVMGLSLDDPPSNLAAAALFYILTSDGQEDRLIDSPSCIRFLMKMVKPLSTNTSKVKAPSIGSKLLALRKDSSCSQGINDVESTSSAIFLKVQELLISCKQMKPRDGKDNVKEKPELSPKWISLLTMEKACLSTISFEETSGNVRKAGGNFKEKFREHGGLDAVFDVTRQCHLNMKRWLSDLACQVLEESKDDVNLESLMLLLKCLKIMENATFLSQDNQSHLLGMRSKPNSEHQPQSFTKLMLSIIQILSGISLHLNTSDSADDEMLCSSSGRPAAEKHNDSNGNNEIVYISSSTEFPSTQWTSSQTSSNLSQNSRQLASIQLGSSKSISDTTTKCPAEATMLKIRSDSSANNSCSGAVGCSNGQNRPSNSSWLKFAISKTSDASEGTRIELLEESQDPFAFDEGDFEPSKWDLLYGKESVSQNEKTNLADEEHKSVCQPHLSLGHEELSSMENQHSSQSSPQASCSSAVDEEKSSLLSNCLLTAVKVLMNLTNDNSVGCRQIASCGGLETLSSLIAGHFPTYSSHFSPSTNPQKHSLLSNKILTDDELDFLVALLGLLVNLVEKNGENRSRLAATSVSCPALKGFESESRDVIPLLCSIFLANQGAGEAAEEGRNMPSDEEDVLLQGEKEAEKMIVEAYSALLLAFLSTESTDIRSAISNCLPDHKLSILVPVLERFVEFHLTLNMISPETHTTVLEVIESCRMP
ncbi:hypothetical protein DCAR_0209094 [Daucus carota subsp. sativus]|uniref:Uncharacterized protein n=1 Tax=Daucus carota subsp. sativus TaxID=79200 RepID=A0A166F0Y7_DAUCS|nr:PREDICTED: uncharacterized protein LOC108209460 [Daucus carota subsp. sativus]WOG89855.1 hypothetical protein DCAR_0209094 [Daucus carota subsp. sativus]